MLKRAEHGKMIAGKSEQPDKVIYLRIHDLPVTYQLFYTVIGVSWMQRVFISKKITYN